MTTKEEYKKQLAANANVKWNQDVSVESFWSFDVAAAPEQVWSYLSDTSRFNRELGLAKRTQAEVDGEVIVDTTLMGIPQQWIEKPWLWVAGSTITAERIYKKGMAKYVQAVFHLENLGDNAGTRVYIYFGWIPANALWASFLKATDGLIRGKFKTAFTKIEDFIRANKEARGVEAFRKSGANFEADQKRRLYLLSEKLLNLGLDKTLVNRLTDMIENGDDLELDAIRVLRLAHDWGVNYRDLLKVSLHASRIGMLNISWDVVCPHCRGPRASAAHLGDIPTTASCKSCDVEFGTDMADVIEVVFKIHPSIRKISHAVYCAAEPAKKNHIKIQLNVAAGEEIKLPAPNISGSYKARIKGSDNEQYFKVDPKFSQKELKLEFADLADRSAEVAPGAVLKFRNESAKDAMLVVSQIQIPDLALRPGHVLFFPEFRDLFSEEHLKTDVKLHLGEHALLFTDIVGSTVFYDKVGDAKAFADVRKHFAEVFAEVKNHRGDVVKTIGDAVMAAFPTSRDAFDATVAIQKRFHGRRDDTGIRLRASVHTGPVIAVHLDTGVDYFGSTINKCAKIQSLAGAGQVVMTEKVFKELNLAEREFQFTTDTYGAKSDRPLPVMILNIS